MNISNNFSDAIKRIIELVDTIEPLDVKDVNIKFQNGHTNWKEYLELYKKCYNNFCRTKVGYKNALDILSKKFDSLNSIDYLDIYSKFLRSYINKTSDSIRQSKDYNNMIHKNLALIVSKIQDFIWKKANSKILMKNYEEVYGIKFSKGPIDVEEIIGNFDESILGNITGSNKGKSVLLGKFNEIRRNLKTSLEDLSEEFSKVKKEAIQLTKISSKSFVSRNILQNSKNSPIQVLSKFYRAIKFDDVMPYYGMSNLLKVPKGFDAKIKNSMEKAIYYIQKLDGDFDRNLDMQSLEKNTEDILKAAALHQKIMSGIIEKIEIPENKQTNQIPEELGRLRSALKTVPEVLNKNHEQELISLLAKALSCDLTCGVICNCFSKLNDNVREVCSAKFEDEDIIKLLFNQNPGKMRSVLTSSISILEFILSTTSIANTILGSFSDRIGDILGRVVQQRLLMTDILNFTKDALQIETSSFFE